MKSKVAAIDFGTNTARLLVVEKSDANHGVIPVCLEREIVRMGGGFCSESGLSSEAMERGIACLKRFSKVMALHGVESVRAVATSAVRDAANKALFLDMVRKETGIALDVIDGIEEGSLTLRGVLSGLDTTPHSLFLFDVGGGSTEFTCMHNGTPTFVKSLPLGVVRLTEGKVTVAEMLKKIDKELLSLQSEMKAKGADWRFGTLVATAGTATTLAAISMEMKDYDYRRVNNSELALDEIKRIYRLLSSLSLAERLNVPGLEKGREDLIIAGCLITIQVMETFGYSIMKVSDYGLLEGLVASF